MPRPTLLAIALAAGLASPAFAGDPAQVPTIDLKAARLDTRTLPNLLSEKALDPAAHYILQLDGPMTPERHESLLAAGVTPGQYLPDSAWIISLTDPARLAPLGFITWLGAFDPAWKLDPQLGKRPVQGEDRRALLAAGMHRVAVVLFDGAAAAESSARIALLSGQINDVGMVGTHWILDATLPTGTVAQLAALASVQFIEDAPEARPRNDSNRWIIQSNTATQTPVWDHGLHGEGQVGGLIDYTPRESHCMFDDVPVPGPTHRKFIGWHSQGTIDSHGTHTAGTMAGDAAPFGIYTTNDGIAFAAKISATGLASISASNLQTSFQADHNAGARVHSNSWGNDVTTAYTSHCQAIDAFTYANEDDVVCFAVSNGSVVTTPENSVNVLGVGASQDTPNQANHCSGGTGPTTDGRRKPEIYAPGCSTTSASSSTTCGTVNFTGTSMACPAIAGSGLLVRQYYTDGFYPSGAANPSDTRIPSGALIRATLLSSTVDMTGIAGFPSNSEGWGRLLLDQALYFAGDARRLSIVDVRNAQGLSTGQSASHPVTVNSSAQPLRVVLVFTAPAAAVNAANPVINNLNLEVAGPGGLYLGNVFSAGQSTTGGVADLKNNVEVVLLSAPPPGQYTITVRAAAVNQGLQGYAIAATGDLGGTCTAPQVTTNPVPQNVNAGGFASFTAAASGSATLAYQWRRNGLDLVDTARITGSHSPSLLISPATLADAGDYDVVVSNACGNDTSDVAVLTILCYPNCDDSTSAPILNVADFSCFLNRFAAADPYANCDASTTVPTLNVADFSCFLNAFAAGCP